MKISRFVFIFLYVLTGVFVVQAQEATAPSGSNVLIFVFLGIVVIAGVAFFFWRRASEEFSDEPYLAKRTTEMAQIILDEDSPIIATISDIRLPIKRPDDDTRPYLVLELRKSTNSFLSAGEGWLIKPEDTPFVIGSQTGVNLRIIDEHVSKEHLMISYDAVKMSYSLIDRDSSNGSRLDGDTMIKQHSYNVRNHEDVTLEIAVSYLFRVYVDDVKTDEIEGLGEDISVDVEVPIQNQLPEQADLPAGTKALLSWISPETKTQQDLEIGQVITQIGRTEVVDVQINHHLISKLHAYIIWKENQFWLMDMSSNGTWLSAGTRGRFRADSGEYMPLDSDITQYIEIARDVVTLNFHYSLVDTARLPEEKAVTDKLPELPVGVRPLLHIVRDGDNEHRREIPISTGIITIGRAENNILHFVRDSVDEEHAKIVWDEGQFWMYDLSGRGTWVDKQSLHRSRVPLKKQRIYALLINQGQSDEILMHFWYDVEFDAEDVAFLKVEQPELTQKIDRSFT